MMNEPTKNETGAELLFRRLFTPEGLQGMENEEAAYRFGFSHGLELAYRVIKYGGDLNDIGFLCNEADNMGNYSSECYTDEMLRKLQDHRGKLGSK